MSCGTCNNGPRTSSCVNPCGVTTTNTAECENLPSQISNFTTHFFGEVTKTEVDGVVSWTLPCNLDVGLENNPRIDGEGLACYFLRLFNDGIMGLTGPQGLPGVAGEDGLNAFTVTTATFAQPDLGSPNIQISTSYNGAILVGMFVFIATSGFYEVTAADGNGTLWLTLTQPLDSAPANITAGKLVVPSGHPGTSVTGPQGIPGAAGPQGSPGESFTAENEFYYTSGGTTYYIQLLSEQVTFVTSMPQVTMTKGYWLLSCDCEIVAGALIATTDLVTVKLRDVTNGQDLNGSTRRVNGMLADDIRTVSTTVRFQVPAGGATVNLFANCSNPNVAFLLPTGTVLTAVKLE